MSTLVHNHDDTDDRQHAITNHGDSSSKQCSLSSTAAASSGEGSNGEQSVAHDIWLGRGGAEVLCTLVRT